MALISRLRTLPILAASLLGCLTASPAHAQNLVYTVHGQFVSVDSTDAAGLDGARFRLTVAIDAAAVPISTDVDSWHQSATYQSSESVLELRESPGGSFDGVFASTVEKMTIVSHFGGDVCIDFGSSFDTPAGIIEVPELCFSGGNAFGIDLSTAGIGTESLAAFMTVLIGDASYGVIDGAIDVTEEAL